MRSEPVTLGAIGIALLAGWLAFLLLANSESTECFYESVEIDIAGGDDLVEGCQELETFTSVNHFLMNERSLAADEDGGVLREPRRDRDFL